MESAYPHTMSSSAPNSPPGALVAQEVFRFGTELTADAVETCPHTESWPGLTVCATYQLDEDTRRKRGRLHAFSVGLGGDGSLSVEQSWTAPCSAVLDAKWSHLRPLLCTAAVQATLEVYQPAHGAEGDVLEPVTSVSSDEASPVFLSLVRRRRCQRCGRMRGRN